MRAHHHPYGDQYLHYPDAGHLFLFQSTGQPQTQLPLGPFTLMLGGGARGDLAAQAQAWPAIGTFLQRALSGNPR